MAALAGFDVVLNDVSVDRLKAGEDIRSPLARLVGVKGYHAERFADGPYPVE